MSQKRKPPAYQEYAATMMATIEYRLLSLAERGLLYSMRLECWVNQRLPSDPEKLAKTLGFTREEILAGLPSILYFFEDREGFLTSPELENYRTELAERLERQSSGGKNGAAKTNEAKRNKHAPSPSGYSSATPSGSSRVLNKDKDRTDKTSQTQPVGNEDDDIPF